MEYFLARHAGRQPSSSSLSRCPSGGVHSHLPPCSQVKLLPRNSCSSSSRDGTRQISTDRDLEIRRNSTGRVAPYLPCFTGAADGNPSLPACLLREERRGGVEPPAGGQQQLGLCGCEFCAINPPIHFH